MPAWIYLASTTGTGWGPTLELAQQHGVIVKAFFRSAPNLQADNNLSVLGTGDPIVPAYRDDHGHVVDAAPFVLAESAALGLPALAALEDPDVQGYRRRRRRRHDIPSVFGVAAGAPGAMIVDAGYDPNRQDPQVNQWVVLCVQQADYPIDVPALDEWYAGVPNKATTVHPAPEGLLD